MAEENKINLNLDFESIVPWNGQQDTGRDVRLKLDRNWKKVVDAFNTLLNGEFLDDKYLRKDKDDRSVGTIASDKGFEAGKFVQEATGAACYQDKDGNWHIETDHLRVRKKAVFTEIEVQEVHHVGGQMLLTAASMIVDYVFEMEDRYRCYFLKKDTDGREVENLWQTGDQAYCNTFNLEKQEDGTLGNHYLWRLVVATNLDTADDAETQTFGDVTIQTADYNFVDLSKEVCAVDSDAPKANDEIVQLGYQPSDDSNRQNAILMAGAGSGSPYIYEFTGINSFTLPEPETRIKPGDNFFTGMMRIQGGSTGAANLEDFPEEVFKAVHIGAVNLLRNSGFTGDYKSEELSVSSSLNSGSELYSKGLKYWTGSAAVSDDANAVSGKCAVVGSLSQTVELIKGESYVVSFKAKGASVKVLLGGESVEKTLSSTYEVCYFKFISDGIGTFSISGDATICDLQLERGTIATDWKPNPNDNDKALAEFQALKYLQDAIKEGDTSIFGGLILSSLIMLGNYKNGVMQKTNAGVSGIYNDDDDVAFWAGGTLEQAIRTIIKFKENPRYKPSASEWANLASFVVSHGGDAVFRGSIFADSGYFRGLVEIANGKIVLKEDGSGVLANGNIHWTPEGIMYRHAPENVEWVHITSYPDRLVDYTLGLYIDVNVDMSNTNEYTLLTPPTNNFSIILSMQGAIARRSSSATIVCPFKKYDGTQYVTVNKIRIKDNVEMAGKEVKLTYRDGYWFNDGGSVDIVGDVAVIGSNNSISCINLEATYGEILILDSASITGLQYYVGDTRGRSENISITDKNGDSHSFTFKEGLLIGYTFTDNDSES